MTGPPSSSYPSRVSPLAARICRKIEENSPVSPETSPASFSVVRPPIPASEKRRKVREFMKMKNINLAEKINPNVRPTSASPSKGKPVPPCQPRARGCRGG